MDQNLVREVSSARTALILLAAAALSGCTPTMGRDFVDNRSALELGKTTIGEVEGANGQPFEDRKNITTSTAQNTELIAKLSPFSAFPVNGEIEVISYFYRRGDSYKKLGLNFHDRVLFEYTLGANFPTLSTDFDDSKIPLLVKGKTTKAETLALFGSPSGEAIFPGVRDRGNTKLRYFFQPPTGPTKSNKRLEAVFNSAGVLVDYQFQSSSSTVPAAAAPTTIPIPIIIPHK